MVLRSTFRLKLLTALVSVVVVLLAIVLVVLRQETDRQIRAAVEQTARRSNQASRDLEELWIEELQRLSLRFTDSTRMPGALEAALEEGDTEVLVEASRYELDLAGMEDALAVFADVDGEPLVALLGGRAWPWSERLPPAREVVEGDQEAVSYRVVGDRIYVVDVVPLGLFGRLLGSVLLGSPLDETAGRRLAEVVGAEVCFVASGEALIASPGVRGRDLTAAMVDLAGAGQTGVQMLEDRSWALIAEPLSPADPDQGMRVVAAPLIDRLAPFQRIEATLRLTGLVALLLALAVGTVIARGLSAPIRRLMKATDRVVAGDLDFEVQVTSSDELGRLAAAFNEMVRGLALKEKYRSVLNKVVSSDVAQEMLKGEVVLGGENRSVTTLFADVRGFTPLTEGMEPQLVIALLNQFMDRAAVAIESEGGVVDKYVGDEVMAVFGAPVAHDDDAARAVRAAVGIRDAMVELNQSRIAGGDPQIPVGIGINTGLAVAGNMGSRDRLNYTVLGESVNLASRLCDAAVGGEILISADTLAAAGDVVEVLSLAPLPVKGLSYPVEVYAVQGVREQGDVG